MIEGLFYGIPMRNKWVSKGSEVVRSVGISIHVISCTAWDMVKNNVVKWLKKLNGAKCWGYEGITLCVKKKVLKNEILRWEGGEKW